MKTQKKEQLKTVDMLESSTSDLPKDDTARFILDIYTLGVTIPRGFVVPANIIPSYFTAGVHYELGSKLPEQLHQAISEEHREILMKVLGG